MVMSGSFNKPILGQPRQMGGFSSEKKNHPARTMDTHNTHTLGSPRGVENYSFEKSQTHNHSSRNQFLRSSLHQQKPNQRNKIYKNAPIVPAGSVTGRSLTLVISIMCFLACLTAVAVYMINQSANAWHKDLSSEISVQVEYRGADTEKVLSETAEYLKGVKGINVVHPLTVEETKKLLEPWLGKNDAINNLPVPRLIALELDRKQNIDIEGVRRDLSQKFEGVFLDDHRQWQNQIRTLTRSLALSGITILLLMTAATAAIIISATKSSMASNREIIEVLHFVGATDRFIAREFEKHFLRLGIRAGCVGALLAIIIFLSVPVIMAALGGSSTMASDMHRLFGSNTIDLASLLLLGIVVVIVSALCVLTSRFGVYRILHSKK